jgi:hypothetical protein
MAAPLSAPKSSSPKASALRTARLVHSYLGVFIAPALLFFALTGAMQTFSLHEKPWGDTGKPPHWIAVLARLHKDQMTYMPPRHREASPAGLAARADAGPVAGNASTATPATAKSAAAPAPSAHEHAHGPNALPMKLFFLLVTLMLASSVVTGLIMAFRYKGNKLALGAALAAGVIVPVGLLFLQKF